MTRYDRSLRLFAVLLAALAGYVDAVGFIALGGFFVSFMSGNTTRLSVGLATRLGDAAIAGALIGCFVAGVVLGSLCGRALRRWRAAAVLALVGVLLAVAAGVGTGGARLAALLLVAAAMGVENTVFQREGEVSIGVTYMTGTLVKLGQKAAAALAGGDPLGWAPYLLLWLGLATGALAGAALFPWLGLHALWLAAGAAGLMAVVSRLLPWEAEDRAPA